MIAESSQDWNVFKQIFADHWPGFKQFRPRYDTPYYDDLVAKMLGCGNPDKMGSIEVSLSPLWARQASRLHEL